MSKGCITSRLTERLVDGELDKAGNWYKGRTEWSHSTPSPIENDGVTWQEMLIKIVGEANIEEWLKRIVNETKQIFYIWEIGHWEEKGLYQEMWVICLCVVASVSR